MAIYFEKLPNEYIRTQTQYIKTNDWKLTRYNLTNDWNKHIVALEGHGEIPKIFEDGKYTIVFIDKIENFGNLSKTNKWTLRSNELIEKKTLITDNGVNYYQFYEKKDV